MPVVAHVQLTHGFLRAAGCDEGIVANVNAYILSPTGVVGIKAEEQHVTGLQVALFHYPCKYYEKG